MAAIAFRILMYLNPSLAEALSLQAKKANADETKGARKAR